MASATASAPAPAPAPASPPSSAAANRSQQQHRVHAEEDQQQQRQTQQERDRLQRTPRLDLQRVAGAGLVLGLLLAVMCVNGQIDGYTAGVDYPVYETVPKGLSFSCQGRVPGYYADTETRCQVWHWCLHSGHQYSFLCPNGTVFNQAVRVCDWWSNVNCPGSEQLYLNNDDLYRQAAEKAGEDI